MAYGNVTQVTTHAVAAQGRLVSQYVDKPNLLALIGIVGARVQAVENTLWDVLTLRSLASATGQQLDNIGKLVGLARGSVVGGEDDAVYRTWLRVQVLINASRGTAPDLLGIVLAAFPLVTVRAIDSGPASVVVRVVGAVSQPTALSAALQLAKAGGVKLLTEYFTVDPALAFTLDGTSAQALDAGLFSGAI
jgi:hypothetical protein